MGRHPIVTTLVAVVVAALFAFVVISTMFDPGIPAEGVGTVVSVESGYAVINVDGVTVEMTVGVLELEPGLRVEYESDAPGAFGLFRHYHVVKDTAGEG